MDSITTTTAAVDSIVDSFLSVAKEETQREIHQVWNMGIVKGISSDEAFKESLAASITKRVMTLLRGGAAGGSAQCEDLEGSASQQQQTGAVEYHHHHYHYHLGSPAAAAAATPTTNNAATVAAASLETLDGFSTAEISPPSTPTSMASHLTVEDAMEAFRMAFNEMQRAEARRQSDSLSSVVTTSSTSLSVPAAAAAVAAAAPPPPRPPSPVDVIALRRQQERIAELSGISRRHVVSNFASAVRTDARLSDTLARRYASERAPSQMTTPPVPPPLPSRPPPSDATAAPPRSASALPRRERIIPVAVQPTRPSLERQMEEEAAAAGGGGGGGGSSEGTAAAGGVSADIQLLRSRGVVSRMGDSFRGRLEAVLRGAEGRLVMPAHRLQRLGGGGGVAAAGVQEEDEPIRASALPAPQQQQQQQLAAPAPIARPAPAPAPAPPRRDLRAAAEAAALLGRFTFPGEMRDLELEEVENIGAVSALLRSDFSARLERLLRERAQGPPGRAMRGSMHHHHAPQAAAILAGAEVVVGAAAQGAEAVHLHHHHHAAPAAPVPAPAPAPAVAVVAPVAPRGLPARWTRDRLLAAAGSGGGAASNSRAVTELQAAVQAMREEMGAMRGIVTACMEMQMDLQRAIRQEVAGAMSLAAQANPQAFSAAQQQAERAQPVRGDNCMICVDKACDAVFYRCGHMCSCFNCARDLQRRGLSCPVCRAPIADVIRAYPA